MRPLSVRRRRVGLGALAAAASAFGHGVRAEAAAPGAPCTPPEPWRLLPPTPALPRPIASGHVEAGGARLFYATFGSPPQEPILLLHGGLANANYWGHVLPALTNANHVIVMDTRGHGRSTMGGEPLGYDLFAADVIALLDHLDIARVRVVGWSDGGITGLALGMAHPGRVASLFVFGANFDLGGLIPHGEQSPVFRQFAHRCAAEYRALSPDPAGFGRLQAALLRMWRSQPRYRLADLGRISAPTMVADGEYDEIIARAHTEALAGAIPAATLLIEPCVSHFALLQQPEAFAHAVLTSRS